MLIPLDEHHLLVFWVQIASLVILARLLGWGMRRVGMPGIIGELAAGVVLGPSIFGKVWPDGFEWYLPGEELQSGALLAVGWVGLAFLLVVTGFETDLGLITKLGKPAAYVTFGSLLFPLFGGIVLGAALPDTFLMPDDQPRIVFVLFIMLAVSVSSLAVVAKILGDLGLMRRDFGQITVAAGMANDVIGWVMLGIFSGLAASGQFDPLDLLSTVGGLLIFSVFAFTLGQKILNAWLRRVRRGQSPASGSLTILFVTALLFAVATQYIGVEAVLGTFVAGVVLNRSRFFDHRALEFIEYITVGFFAPLFFALAGLRVNLGELGNTTTLTWAIVIIAVAMGVKFIGTYWGALLAERTNRGALALGAGLNARGALEIVIATVALDLKVFNETSYTVIVLVPIVTSLFASIALRLVVRGWRGDPGEIERLEREEALSGNLLVNASRILLPSRGGRASIGAAQVMQFAWPLEAGATILTVDQSHGRLLTRFLRGGERGDASGNRLRPAQDLSEIDITPLRNVFYEREVDHRTVRAPDVVDAIVSESQLGYGVIGLGVAKNEEGILSISDMAEELLTVSTLPILIVRPPSSGHPAAFSRVLVPAAARPTTRMACEVAFSISAQLGTQVTLAHIVEDRSARGSRRRSSSEKGTSAFLFPDLRPQQGAKRRSAAREASTAREVQQGEEILEKTHMLAQEMGVEARSIVHHSATAAEGILEAGEAEEADLIILGAQLRRVNNRLFLGSTAEQVLQESPATVAVVLTPFDL